MKKLLNIVIITAMIISSCNMFSISVGAEEFVNENVLINGGFEDDEIKSAKEANINIVTLGPRILRCETAPVAVISAAMYELGDWKRI